MGCMPDRALTLPVPPPPTSPATAAQASLLPYFPTIMEHLREFLVTGHEDLRPVQIQSLGEWGVCKGSDGNRVDLLPVPAGRRGGKGKVMRGSLSGPAIVIHAHEHSPPQRH